MRWTCRVYFSDADMDGRHADLHGDVRHGNVRHRRHPRWQQHADHHRRRGWLGHHHGDRYRCGRANGYVMQTIMVTIEAADMTPAAPSNVMATADDTDPGDLMITVTWTDGENVEAHGVVLFNSDFSEWPYIARGMNGSHTFSDVDAGSYVAVVVALNADGTLLTDADGAYLFGPGNSVTIGQ